MKGEEKPDYKSCVAISTTAALHEMLLPGLMAVIIPVVVGVVLGVDALGGLLSGSLVTGVLMAIFMSNAGGAWDNAKKYIETGHHGGKGSEAHKGSRCRRYGRRSVQGYFRSVHQYPDQADDSRFAGICSIVPSDRRITVEDI